MSIRTRSAIRQAPHGPTQADFGRADAFGELALVVVKGGLERARIERVGPHHQGVFAVVAVIAAPYTHLFEGVLAIQVLGDRVGCTHLEGHPARANLDRAMDQGDQQQLADTHTPHVRMRGDRGDVGFVSHDPDAGVADNAFELLLELCRAWLRWLEQATYAADQVGRLGLRLQMSRWWFGCGV